MTHDEFNSYITKLVAVNLESNVTALQDSVKSALSKVNSPNEIQSALVVASIKFSVDFSTKLVFELLNQLDVLSIENLVLQNVKPDLYIVPPVQD